MSEVGLKQAVVVSGGAHDVNRFSERIALRKADGTSAFAIKVVTTATAIGTAAKTTTATEPGVNELVAVKFTNGNSATSPTLAFAGGSARAMTLGGTASAAAKITVAANGVVLFLFDGTLLHQIGTMT